MLRGWQRRLLWPQCGSYCPNTIQGGEELGDDAGFEGQRGESHECDRPAAFQKERPIKEQADRQAAGDANADAGRRGDLEAWGQLAERYGSPTLEFACSVAGPMASGKRTFSFQAAHHADDGPRGECMMRRRGDQVTCSAPGALRMMDQVGGDQVNCLAHGALRVAQHDEWGDGRHAVPPDGGAYDVLSHGDVLGQVQSGACGPGPSSSTSRRGNGPGDRVLVSCRFGGRQMGNCVETGAECIGDFAGSTDGHGWVDMVSL